MNREYDIFENFPGGPVWRCSVVGRTETMAKLYELAQRTSNELFAMYLIDQEIIARVNQTSTISAPAETRHFQKGNRFQQPKPEVPSFETGNPAKARRRA